LFAAFDADPSAESRHALGLYYLAERQYDRAIDHLQMALQSGKESSQFHNDLGVALFEKGRGEVAIVEGGLSVQAFAESLAHLNRALALEPDLNEALFNRALLRQQMMLKGRAEEDWRAYLEKDSSSNWAEEARRHLGRLEENKLRAEQSRSGAAEDFLNAYRLKNSEKAWKLFSSNREKLITHLLGVYLKGYGQSSQDLKDEALDALAYAGELDKQRVGDHTTANTARFYQLASTQQLVVARQAHDSMQLARANYETTELKEAVIAYGNAHRLFKKIKDSGCSQLARFWLGLCHWELSHTARSNELWEELVKEAEADKHYWLQALTLHMLSGVAFKRDEYSRAITYSTRAREVAERIKDVTCIFSADAARIEYYRLLGHQEECMAQVGLGLPMLDNASIGMIALWRYHDIVAMACFTFGLYDAAIDWEREALQYAASSGNYVLLSVSHANLGLIYGKQQDFSAAFAHVEEAYQIAAPHASQTLGQLQMAFAAVQKGHLHRERNEFAQALAAYDQAVELHGVNNLDFSVHLYQAYRGRFASYIAIKDIAAAQQQLSILLDVLEKHRATITEGENRNNFFAAEQGIYDQAIGFAYSHLQDGRQAFAYAEVSRARSLLDSMTAGAQVADRNGNPDLMLRPGAQPLPLGEIQNIIPADACLLYYVLLEDRLLIWGLSGSELYTGEAKISQAVLTDMVMRYYSAVSGSSDTDREVTGQLARELYSQLIAPVESMIGGRNRLYIVPDKALHYLPWDALISPVTGRFIVQDYAVTVSPSATLFALCTALAGKKAGALDEHVLGVGDPLFDRRAFPKLAPLSDAAYEARKIVDFYPSKSPLLGGAAREQVVRNELIKADVAHFALHCVINERSAMRSTLVLAKEPAGGADAKAPDGLLQAYEVYDIRLPRTRLAVLSACETGVTRYFRGEGMMSMARAFLVARVPLVVASLWPVESSATAELMVRFHMYRKRDGRPTDEALRRAKCDLLDGKVERHRQPVYWAAFQPIGGHADY
jgi:CHAT domain-containing protein